MSKSKLMNPGSNSQKSGQYTETGPKGGVVKDARVVEVKSGDRLPPTSKAGNKWTQK